MEQEPNPPMSRDRVLRVAASLFRSQGYAGTTIRQLSSELGLQSASLYHHIRSKEELLYELCRNSLTHILRATQDLPAPPSDLDAATAEERLRAFIRRHVEAALEDQDKHATMLIELRSLSPAKRETIINLRDQYERQVRDAISEAQEAGAVRSDLPARHLGLALLNLLNWTIFWFSLDGDLTADQVGDLLATVFLEGAGTGSSPDPLKQADIRID